MFCKDFDRLNCWLEIYPNVVIDNLKTVKKHLNKKCKICCVVKANAYGHGSAEIAKVLEKEDIYCFGVANINEGISLRNAGIKKPILIFGYTNPLCADLLLEHNLTQSIFSFEYAQTLIKNLHKKGKIQAHIKVNTGMNRLGFNPNNKEHLEEVVSIYKDSHFIIDGIFTHFYNADSLGSKEKDTIKQFEIFTNFVNDLEKHGVVFNIKHCSNSAATINFPNMQLDMVRVGASLYGINVSDKIKVKEAMCLKARISQIAKIKKGDIISYGARFVADKEMTIATITAGYADGIWRSNFNKLEVTIRGHRCKVVGTICMDQMMVDVSETDCFENDEVIIYGKNGMPISEIAKNNSTISYEIMCDVGYRAKRKFIL